MKTVKKIQICIFATALITLNACVENDDFNTPISLDQPFTLGRTTSQQILALSLENTPSKVKFLPTKIHQRRKYLPIRIVISSDEGGNFFEEIVIQDSPRIQCWYRSSSRC